MNVPHKYRLKGGNKMRKSILVLLAMGLGFALGIIFMNLIDENQLNQVEITPAQDCDQKMWSLLYDVQIEHHKVRDLGENESNLVLQINQYNHYSTLLGCPTLNSEDWLPAE